MVVKVQKWIKKEEGERERVAYEMHETQQQYMTSMNNMMSSMKMGEERRRRRLKECVCLEHRMNQINEKWKMEVASQVFGVMNFDTKKNVWPKKICVLMMRTRCII